MLVGETRDSTSMCTRKRSLDVKGFGPGYGPAPSCVFADIAVLGWVIVYTVHGKATRDTLQKMCPGPNLKGKQTLPFKPLYGKATNYFKYRTSTINVLFSV